MVSFSKQAFVHRSHAIRSPSARRSVPFHSSSARHLLAVCLSFARRLHCSYAVRVSSALSVRRPLILRTPSASCPRVLHAPSAVRPPYVALFHKTKLKRFPSN
ncbi:hypothetical protein DEO72_LG4g1019 [Vigna unguiculata]|uniref:Uncharacterized protein n=1 Tax=Vigna unguiculata TaxID=3917 RepID=A0A4D6LNC8_VIGUN|nr:hypothetical protein DEO72_LG4g1019 [Vigna unguiculata]